MSHQLTLELNDTLYNALQEKASASGQSLADWLILELQQQTFSEDRTLATALPKGKLSQRFLRHAGAVSLGYATGIDNESIDADLAKAYANDV